MANPYQPLTTIDDPSRSAGGPFEVVVRVAALQRHLNLAVLANLFVSSLLLELGKEIPSLLLLRVLAGVATYIFSTITAIRLSDALFGRNWAVVCAALIPVVNLFTLLILSSRATKRLREEGIKVGFLGASPAAVRARIEVVQTECTYCAMQICEEKSVLLCKVCKRPVHRDCRKTHMARAHAKS